MSETRRSWLPRAAGRAVVVLAPAPAAAAAVAVAGGPEQRGG